MPKKLDDFQIAIKKSLKKQYPDLSDKEIETRSWAMAQKAYKDWKKKGEKQTLENKITEDGKKIVSERIIKEHIKVHFDSPIEEDLKDGEQV